MPKFRKKPVVIEARQVHQVHEGGCNCQDLIAWIGMSAYLVGAGIEIETLEGTMAALPGDWIIKGVAGEFYACKPYIFEQTYELVEAGPDSENIRK